MSMVGVWSYWTPGLNCLNFKSNIKTRIWWFYWNRAAFFSHSIVCLNLIPCFCFDVMKSQTAFKMKIASRSDSFIEFVDLKISTWCSKLFLISKQQFQQNLFWPKKSVQLKSHVFHKTNVLIMHFLPPNLFHFLCPQYQCLLLPNTN